MLQLITTKPEDLSMIASIARRIWNIHYPPIIGQAQVDYMLEKFYDSDALKKQQAEGQDFYIIENNNIAIGFISVSKKENNCLFIHKFYIDASEQGKGLGEEVFELIKSLLKFPDNITLTVNRQNHKAINFYFKLGFKIKEVANFDIGNGYVLNDFVMEMKN